MRKRTLRAVAAGTLFVWVMALAACFLHCHYPGSLISAAHSVSVETKCCSSQSTSAPEKGHPGENAACMAFKTVTLNGKSAVIAPPFLALFAWTPVFAVEMNETATGQCFKEVSITDSSPPLVALLKPTLLNLPPPFPA